jgi:hypothetical protein
MNAQAQQTFDILRGHIDPATARKLILNDLCYDQMSEQAFGEDQDGNWCQIMWIDNDGNGYWNIEGEQDGTKYHDEEWGDCEKIICDLSDEIILDMCENSGLEPDYEETA